MKGKAVAFADVPILPPLGLLSESGMKAAEEDRVVGMEDWRRFMEAGFLDEAEMERRDLAAVSEKVSRLEREVWIECYWILSNFVYYYMIVIR